MERRDWVFVGLVGSTTDGRIIWNFEDIMKVKSSQNDSIQLHESGEQENKMICFRPDLL